MRGPPAFTRIGEGNVSCQTALGATMWRERQSSVHPQSERTRRGVPGKRPRSTTTHHSAVRPCSSAAPSLVHPSRAPEPPDRRRRRRRQPRRTRTDLRGFGPFLAAPEADVVGSRPTRSGSGLRRKSGLSEIEFTRRRRGTEVPETVGKARG